MILRKGCPAAIVRRPFLLWYRMPNRVYEINSRLPLVWTLTDVQDKLPGSVTRAI